MKKLLVLIACGLYIHAAAQIEKVTLQASGLTCSMCSKAIYKSLEKLPFAGNITADIKESTYFITYKKDDKVDFDAIQKAVEDAGFSVIKMEVKAHFDGVQVKNDAHIFLNGKAFHFLDVKDQVLNGEQTFRIVDKKFVADKVYKKYAAFTQLECVKSGHMKPCCPKGLLTGNRIYHITV